MPTAPRPAPLTANALASFIWNATAPAHDRIPDCRFCACPCHRPESPALCGNCRIDRRTDHALRARVDEAAASDDEIQAALAAAFPCPSLRPSDHRPCCPWRASSFNHRPPESDCCCEDGRRVCKRHGVQP